MARGRGRLNRALAWARAPDSGRLAAALWRGAAARRSATRELEAAGVVRRRGLRRRLELTDRSAAASRFRRLSEAVAAGAAPGEREEAWIVLLAYAGVLARRFSRHERRLAVRQLRRLGAGALELERLRGARASRTPATQGVATLGYVGLGELGWLASAACGQLLAGDGGGGGGGGGGFAGEGGDGGGDGGGGGN